MTVTDNFAFCAEAGAKGIDLKAEFNRMNEELTALKKEVDERKAQEQALHAREFAVLESRASDDPEVRKARRALADKRDEIVHTACMKDGEYSALYGAYKEAVLKATDKGEGMPTPIDGNGADIGKSK